MYINKHTNVDTFMDETLEYLEQMKYNLMLGICYRVNDNPNIKKILKTY